MALRIEQGQNSKCIQNQLGHASIQTTFDRYGHLISDVNTEQAKKLDNIKGDVRAERAQLPYYTLYIGFPPDERNRVTQEFVTPIRGNAGSKITCGQTFEQKDSPVRLMKEGINIFTPNLPRSQKKGLHPNDVTP